MEEKLRPWKVPTSVWAVGAPYPPYGHTGRKPALTVGARFVIKIQDFLNCRKTLEHVKQGFSDFIFHIFNCASIIHSFETCFLVNGTPHSGPTSLIISLIVKFCFIYFSTSLLKLAASYPQVSLIYIFFSYIHQKLFLKSFNIL